MLLFHGRLKIVAKFLGCDPKKTFTIMIPQPANASTFRIQVPAEAKMMQCMDTATSFLLMANVQCHRHCKIVYWIMIFPIMLQIRMVGI